MTTVDAPPVVTAAGRLHAAALTASMGAVFAGVTVATAILPAYRTRWNLSVSAVTVVFVSYVAGVVVALLVLGQLADVIGARPVVLAAVLASVVAAVAASAAPTEAWLIAARAGHGLAVGLIPGAVTAALRTHVDRPLAARLTAIATTGGITLGLVIGAAFAVFGPSAVWLAYLVVLAPITGYCLATVRPATHVAVRGHWSVRRPALPRAGRRQFVLALGTAAVCFAAVGLYAGLGPLIVADHAHGVVLGALLAAGAYVVSGLVQFSGLTLPTRTGAGVLVLGVAALALATRLDNLPALLVSAALVGAGNGLLFPTSLATVNRLAPPGRSAGAVSTYYLSLYAGLAVPLLGLGLLADATSLATAVELLAAVIALGGVLLLLLLPDRAAPTPTAAV